MENKSGGTNHQSTTKAPPKSPPIIWTSVDGSTVLRAAGSEPSTEYVPGPGPRPVLTPNQIHAVKTVAVWGGVSVAGIGAVMAVGVVVIAVWKVVVIGVCAVAVPALSVSAWTQYRHRNRFRDIVRSHDQDTASTFKASSGTRSGKTVNITINNF